MSKAKKSCKSVYLEDLIWDRLGKSASNNNRSVNNLIETVLISYLLNEELKKDVK